MNRLFNLLRSVDLEYQQLHPNYKRLIIFLFMIFWGGIFVGWETYQHINYTTEIKDLRTSHYLLKEAVKNGIRLNLLPHRASYQNTVIQSDFNVLVHSVEKKLQELDTLKAKIAHLEPCLQE